MSPQVWNCWKAPQVLCTARLWVVWKIWKWHCIRTVMDVVPIIKNLGGLPLLTLELLLPTVASTREKFLSCWRGGCPNVSYVEGLARLGKGSLLLARTMLLVLGCIASILGFSSSATCWLVSKLSVTTVGMNASSDIARSELLVPSKCKPSSLDGKTPLCSVVVMEEPRAGVEVTKG